MLTKVKHDGSEAPADDSSDDWSRRLREPLPRRKLSPGILALLWILRIYVMIAVPLVIYAFFTALYQRH
jgi:hypothetical protein